MVAHHADVAQRVTICKGNPILFVLLVVSTLRLDCLRTENCLRIEFERCRGLEHLIFWLGVTCVLLRVIGSDLGRHAAEYHAYHTLPVRNLVGCGEAAREEGHGQVEGEGWGEDSG